MKVIGTSAAYRDANMYGVVVRFEQMGKQYIGYVDFSTRTPQGEVIEVSDQASEQPVQTSETVKAEIVKAVLRSKILMPETAHCAFEAGVPTRTKNDVIANFLFHG